MATALVIVMELALVLAAGRRRDTCSQLDPYYVLTQAQVPREMQVYRGARTTHRTQDAARARAPAAGAWHGGAPSKLEVLN